MLNELKYDIVHCWLPWCACVAMGCAACWVLI